jgi:hypothetical protein
MAVTRIKNNQITDSTITTAKIASGTLVGSNFNANLTLNSNVTIIGNLSVTGTTSTVSSTNTYVNDPIVVFNNGYTGSLTGYDIGILVNRNLGALSGYGSVNAAFVWSEADAAFIAITTTDTGTGITSLNNSGFANVKLGNVTANSLTINGTVSGQLTGNAALTYTTTTNFSTANAVITGGSITGTPAAFTTATATNFSTGNAVISGGNGAFTTLTATNLSSGNIVGVLTGTASTANVSLYDSVTATSTNASYYVQLSDRSTTGNASAFVASGITFNPSTNNLATTTFTGTFSGTASITSGSIAGATGQFSTLTATNFSTANAVISGGSLNGTTVGATTASTGAFTTLSASGLTYVSSATTATTANTGALVVAGGVGIGGNLYVGGISVLSGNVTIGGNLTVSGNSVSIGASTLSINDPIINLNTPADLTPLTVATTSDIGLKFHYYDTSDSAAFVGRAADTGALEWYARGTDTANVFTGTAYGTIKTGALILANVRTVGGGLTANTGTLQVWGDGSLTGNLFVGASFSTPAINNTVIGNVTPLAGTFTSLTATGSTTTTATATNFSTGNAVISGGAISGSTGQFSTLTATNFSTGNAIISGGNAQGLTYLQTTNFSTANAAITGGAISGVTLQASTATATNFSTANAVITGGSINGTTVGATTASTGAFTTLSASNNFYVSQTTASTTANTGAAVIVGGVGIGGNVFHGNATTLNSTKTAGSDTIVKGKTDDTLIWAKAGASYDQVLIGNSATMSTLVAGAKLQINSSDSMLLPVGTNAQRPSSVGQSDVQGMFRYNTTGNAIEWYTGSAWVAASTAFTVIADQQASGDGTTTVFTLSEAQTTNSCIVSINGVIQIPTLAYAVTGGTTLTFTEAPASGDVIDIRKLTTTSTVTGIASTNGYMQVQVDNNGVYVYTGSSSTSATTYWETGGAKVNASANTAVASANTATTLDTFVKTTYRSARYVVQATYQGQYQVSEVLVIQDGTTASAVEYGTVRTNSNLGVVSATVSGSNTLLQFVAANAATNVRITKDYNLI